MKIDLSEFKFESGENTQQKNQTESTPPRANNSLPELLENDLKLVFVGFNPSLRSAQLGHYYAHPSNKFYKLAFWSKLTSNFHSPKDDVKFLTNYRIGFTDLCARPSRQASELSKHEQLTGLYNLHQKITKYKPIYVCFVGKAIWQLAARQNRWPTKSFKYGLTSNVFAGSKVLVVPSTSGLNVMKTADQLAIWQEVASLLQTVATMLDDAQDHTDKVREKADNVEHNFSE